MDVPRPSSAAALLAPDGCLPPTWLQWTGAWDCPICGLVADSRPGDGLGGCVLARHESLFPDLLVAAVVMVLSAWSSCSLACHAAA